MGDNYHDDSSEDEDKFIKSSFNDGNTPSLSSIEKYLNKTKTPVISVQKFKRIFIKSLNKENTSARLDSIHANLSIEDIKPKSQYEVIQNQIIRKIDGSFVTNLNKGSLAHGGVPNQTTKQEPGLEQEQTKTTTATTPVKKTPSRKSKAKNAQTEIKAPTEQTPKKPRPNRNTNILKENTNKNNNNNNVNIPAANGATTATNTANTASPTFNGSTVSPALSSTASQLSSTSSPFLISTEDFDVSDNELNANANGNGNGNHSNNNSSNKYNNSSNLNSEEMQIVESISNLRDTGKVIPKAQTPPIRTPQKNQIQTKSFGGVKYKLIPLPPSLSAIPILNIPNLEQQPKPKKSRSKPSTPPTPSILKTTTTTTLNVNNSQNVNNIKFTTTSTSTSTSTSLNNIQIEKEAPKSQQIESTPTSTPQSGSIQIPQLLQLVPMTSFLDSSIFENKKKEVNTAKVSSTAVSTPNETRALAITTSLVTSTANPTINNTTITSPPEPTPAPTIANSTLTSQSEPIPESLVNILQRQPPIPVSHLFTELALPQVAQTIVEPLSLEMYNPSLHPTPTPDTMALTLANPVTPTFIATPQIDTNPTTNTTTSMAPTFITTHQKVTTTTTTTTNLNNSTNNNNFNNNNNNNNNSSNTTNDINLTQELFEATMPLAILEQPVSQEQVILLVSIYHPVRFKKVLEILVLGSQKLTELRDKIYCLSDCILDGAERKSGYFFINNCFYDDTRYETNYKYSEHVIRWLRLKNREASQFSQSTMEGTTFDQLNISLGERYLYCHQGGCEHFMIFEQLRMVNENDDRDPSKYPIIKYQQKIRRRKCLVCDIYAAKYVTLCDKLTDETPFFYCDDCYRAFHYNSAGNLLYSEYQVFPYYHD